MTKKSKPATKAPGRVPLPRPVTLSDEMADQAANLQKLMDAAAILNTLMNGTINQANQHFWNEVIAHYSIDVTAYNWTVDGNKIVPVEKPANPFPPPPPAAGA